MWRPFSAPSTDADSFSTWSTHGHSLTELSLAKPCHFFTNQFGLVDERAVCRCSVVCVVSLLCHRCVRRLCRVAVGMAVSVVCVVSLLAWLCPSFVLCHCWHGCVRRLCCVTVGMAVSVVCVVAVGGAVLASTWASYPGQFDMHSLSPPPYNPWKIVFEFPPSLPLARTPTEVCV